MDIASSSSDAQSSLAEEVRQRLLAQTGNAQLVQRLAPRQPGEAEAARRARGLYAALAQSMGLQSQPLLQVRRLLSSGNAVIAQMSMMWS